MALGLALTLELTGSGCAWMQQEEPAQSQQEDTWTGAEQLQEAVQTTVSDAAQDKEETVEVEADATGKVKQITVETRLRHGQGATIEDYSILKDIQNTEGDEAYTLFGDGKLLWEDHGEDIYYEGTTDKALPVELSISYALDGKPIEPQQLAGKSGSLRMRFDYRNLTGETVQVGDEAIQTCIPFMAVSMVFLPEEVFSQVEVENGKLMEFGDERIAVGYAFPGLADSLRLQEFEKFKDVDIPEYVEITAEVTDFTLDFTATVISPECFADLDEEDLDDIDELVDDMDELRDASKELVDGTVELKDGVEEFGDYLVQYVDAIAAVKEGTAGIQQGVGVLRKNSKALVEGASGLQAGLEALQKSLGETSGEAVEEAEDGQEGQDAADLVQILDDMEKRLEKLEQLEKESGVVDESAKRERDGLKEDIMMLRAAYTAMAGASSASMTQLKLAVDQLAQGSAQLTEGVQAFSDGIGKLYKGSEKLNSGVGELKEAGQELTDGYDELKDGVKEFRDGVKEFDEEGIQELADMAGKDLQGVANRLRAAKRADGRYTNFGGIAPGRTGKVQFVIETEKIEEK